MKYCDQCGAQLKDKVKFCSICGSPTAPTFEILKITVCRICGKPIGEGISYCANCGKTVVYNGRGEMIFKWENLKLGGYRRGNCCEKPEICAGIEVTI